MRHIIFIMSCLVLMTSCNDNSVEEYNKLQSDVNELKTKIEVYQKNIKHQNLTQQDIDDRQYEVDRMNNILHADERSIYSCIQTIKSYETYVHQNDFDKTDEHSLHTIYKQINNIHAELQRCSKDISSEGLQMTME